MPPTGTRQQLFCPACGPTEHRYDINWHCQKCGKVNEWTHDYRCCGNWTPLLCLLCGLAPIVVATAVLYFIPIKERPMPTAGQHHAQRLLLVCRHCGKTRTTEYEIPGKCLVCGTARREAYVAATIQYVPTSGQRTAGQPVVDPERLKVKLKQMRTDAVIWQALTSDEQQASLTDGLIYRTRHAFALTDAGWRVTGGGKPDVSKITDEMYDMLHKLSTAGVFFGWSSPASVLAELITMGLVSDQSGPSGPKYWLTVAGREAVRVLELARPRDE